MLATLSRLQTAVLCDRALGLSARGLLPGYPFQVHDFAVRVAQGAARRLFEAPAGTVGMLCRPSETSREIRRMGLICWEGSWWVD